MGTLWLLRGAYNLSEATMRYNFEVSYVPGKKNIVADFLS